jgi:hypothetical protein
LLPHDGRTLTLSLHLCDDAGGKREQIEQVALKLTLFGANPGDELDISFNGVTISIESFDWEWKDGQIFSPKPQPASGGSGQYPVNPNQRLLLVEAPLAPGLCKLGNNTVAIRAAKRGPYPPGNQIAVEKLEVWVTYKNNSQE